MYNSLLVLPYLQIPKQLNSIQYEFTKLDAQNTQETK